MIISHKYQFIFLKTKKTAGTSAEISLSRYCDGNDILTPLINYDEEIRKKLGKKPQNYWIGDNQLYNHISAEKVKNYIGEDIWNSYYKFCFERNPWDKVVSYYYFIVKDQTEIDFNTFIQRGMYKHVYNYPIYTSNDNIAVDYVGKYENVAEELNQICNKLRLPYDGWLPRAKGDFRKKREHYSNYYNSSQAKIIQEYFQKEINLFGYTF